MIEKMEKFYTTRELAALLKQKPATIRRWIKEKKLKAVRFGNEYSDWRIPESEAVRLVNDAYGRNPNE